MGHHLSRNRVKPFVLDQSSHVVRIQEVSTDKAGVEPKGKRSRTASGMGEDSVESSDEDQDGDDTWDVMDGKMVCDG